MAENHITSTDIGVAPGDFFVWSDTYRLRFFAVRRLSHDGKWVVIGECARTDVDETLGLVAPGSTAGADAIVRLHHDEDGAPFLVIDKRDVAELWNGRPAVVGGAS